MTQKEEGRVLHLFPDEIDLFITTLNLYKSRIKGGWVNID